MKHNLSASEIAKVFRSAIADGILKSSDPLAMFIDLDFLNERVSRLQSCFPQNTLNAVAIKANPSEKILVFLNHLKTGAEAASFAELKMALNAGYSTKMIVFDSPVKTISELEYAIEKGVHINIDSLAELDRVITIRKKKNSGGSFGIRINPQTGTGKIATSSVAGEYSKFGVPIKLRRKELLDAFIENVWLKGVHLHVGSQGCSPDMLLDGIAVIYDFVKEVNLLKGYQQINIIDIGGGLPVSYNRNFIPYTIEDYSREIKQRFPELFDVRYKLITEFGRWVHVNPGWTVSRVEYLKDDGGKRTAMLHAGADLFLRECLLPHDWKHEYTVLDKKGNEKPLINITPCTLAGPLCFSGDILAKDVMLPVIEEGDFIVIHDTGGYTLSMWSRYNSRLTPPVIGYTGSIFSLLRKGETPEDLIDFWR